MPPASHFADHKAPMFATARITVPSFPASLRGPKSDADSKATCGQRRR
ncbi:hypothetical protein I547_5380 [Mycobacterium kansasii 824]|nr:hypothetical protein I547_5380 [Mycobacterium kansasii 824]